MRTVEEAIQENREKYEKLQFAFTQRKKSTLGLIIYETYDYQAKIYQEIQQLLPEYKFLKVDVGAENITSLHRYLKEYLPAEVIDSQQISYVINVFNLANSLLTYEEGKIKPSWLTAQINLERELLFRDIPCVLLIWLDKPSAEQFRKEAPDFWDWLTYIFEFKTPENEKLIEPIAYDQALPQRGADPEVLERIKDLEEKLARLDHSQPKMRIWREEKSIRYLLAQELVKAYRYEEALYNYKIVLSLLNKIKADNNEKASVLFLIGDVYFQLKDFDTALKNYELSLNYNIPISFAGLYHQFGRIYEEKGEWRKAINHYEIAIKWSTKHKDLFHIGNLYHQIGMVYLKKGELNQALNFYQKAIELDLKISNFSGLGRAFHQVGFIFFFQQRLDKAINSFENALNWKIKANNLYEISSTYHQIGMIWQLKKDFTKALENYQKAIEWIEKTHNYFELGSTYYQMGLLYENENNMENAILSYKKSLEWTDKTMNSEGAYKSYRALGLLYFQMKDYDLSLFNLIQSLDIIIKFEIIDPTTLYIIDLMINGINEEDLKNKDLIEEKNKLFENNSEYLKNLVIQLTKDNTNK